MRDETLIQKVKGKLRSSGMDYNIDNVAYAWVMKLEGKLPDGNLSGVIYGSQGIKRGYVIVYSCDIMDKDFADGKEVWHMWENPNWQPYSRPFYKPTTKGKRGPRKPYGPRKKKNLTETA